MSRLRFARALDSMGLVDAILSATKRTLSPHLTVLTFHRVAEPKEAKERFDTGVIDTTPELFDRQLAFLSQNFDVLSMDEVRAGVEGAEFPKRPLLITFDDGYRDNYEVALPLLEKHRARATFFIATHYIENRRLFWWDRIALLVRSTEKERVTLDYPYSLSLEFSGDRAVATKQLLSVVKHVNGLDLERFLTELAERAGVALDAAVERELTQELLMSWDEIRELARRGMDVQSHTHTHRVLHTLSSDDLTWELSESKRMLEERLGSEIYAISYPVGRPISDTPEIPLAVKSAGYTLGFSNKTGASFRVLRNPMDIRRISTDVEFPMAFFRAICAVPGLAYGA